MEGTNTGVRELKSPSQIVLASGSPRRHELLALSGWPYTVAPADVDETPIPEEDPRDYVLRIASHKAMATHAQVGENVLIVAADTTVAADGEILGKPANAPEALSMLRRLRGRTHEVYTALAVMWENELRTALAGSAVPMRAYTDSEMHAYVKTGDPFDKAGAYAIQHGGFHPVEEMQACYANVIGLPLCHLTRLMAEIGVKATQDVPASCQAHLGYDCPVYQQVLEGKL